MTHDRDRRAAPAAGRQDAARGLARERTELAWIRTALSFAALGGAMLKVDPALGVLVLAASALVWVIGRLARRPARDGVHAQPGLLLLITIAVIFVALAALAAALLGGGVPLPAHNARGL
jgi:uncharacterized membrane protein YidH (DUF202 family)